MFADINGTLLRHLATASGAAYTLRHLRPQLLREAHAFVSARSDVKRLDAGQLLASEILRKNNLDDLILLRDIVARQELRRQINYLKQKDHTAHTVYLYLLGLWLYDNLPEFQHCFAMKHNIKRWEFLLQTPDGEVLADRLDAEFLFQWVYASLLHDIGYVFFDLSSESAADRQEINDLFSWKSVRSLYGELCEEEESALLDAHGEWHRRHSKVHTLTSFAEGAFAEILEFLADAPWLGDLLPSLAGKDLLAVLELNQSPLLRNYAFEVARTGYDVKPDAGNGCVDHAVASGLFLLRYTTFWYWLMNHVRNNAPSALLSLSDGFDYKVENLQESIIPACRAVAFHNIRPTVPCGGEIIPLLTLEDEPLTFLSILCDELQIWDRSPAGRADLANYRQYARSALDGSEIEIMCIGPRSNSKALMVNCAGPEFSGRFERLRQDLESRLPGWSRLIEIKVV